VFPEWWLFAPLPFGGALLVIEFVRRILHRTAAVTP
jgi:TRAP-type C4-dicarboxylate transport system permease small subunit